jgi:hypothetical protein
MTLFIAETDFIYPLASRRVVKSIFIIVLSCACVSARWIEVLCVCVDIAYLHSGPPSWPRVAPGTARLEWTSVKKADGSSSICLTWKPSPESTPSVTTPVLKGPLRQPTLFLRPSESSTGLGKAILHKTIMY